MKQAVQEGFILDVLKSYTPVNSYYKLVKTVEGDPEFDVKKARKKLRRYVESHDTAIRLKAEIMVDHFHEQVIALGKIKGQARAMVVTNGIERAVQYYTAFKDYLVERKSPHRAIVAFSGEHDFGDGKVTESSLNGFPSSEIRTASRRTRTGSSSAPTSSRPATTSRFSTRCTSTRGSRASRRCRRSRA
jgi:type I restriction enzyme R subunit